MEDKKNLKIIGGVLIGIVAIGVSILSVNALKDVKEDRKGK